MFNKGMGLVGVLIVISLAFLTGMPALAAQPVQGGHPGFGPGNVSETTRLAHAENLTSTLGAKGVDVSGLNAALSDARNAIQNSNITAFKDAMKSFGKALIAGTNNGSIPKSGIYRGDHEGVMRNHTGTLKNGTFTPTPAMETKELDFAKNLTNSLGTKGVDVSGLNAALTDAQNAIQNSNSTAFKEAMKNFNQAFREDIKSGVISQSDLPQLIHGPMRGNGPDVPIKPHTRVNATHTA
jgi:hypothetical protein